jgi:phosphohistidine swiveling domain-containing protein
MPSLIPLHELNPAAETEFGGKAAGLARLVAAGARVPRGFACSITAAPPGEWPAIERERFLAYAAELLDGARLAIRSSAAGEDAADRSFAGQFETVLGAKTPDEGLAAAGRCIASGSNERVTSYAGATGIPVGVVAQQMVEARAAGVCFTLDPMGEDRAVVVEAIAGLGDALVSGRADAERWRVYRNGRGEWEPHPSARGAVAVLAEKDAAAIASEADALRAREGRPLDLEWAIDAGGTLWWLQERPITSWRPPPEYRVERSAPGADDGPITVWSNWNVRETMPDPMHPLTWGVWKEIVAPMALRQLLGVDVRELPFRELASLDLVQGRIYFNLSGLLGVPGLGPLAVALMRHLDARAGETVCRLRDSGVLTPRRRRFSAARFAFFSFASMAASMRRLPSLAAPRRALRLLERGAEAVKARASVPTMTDAELTGEMSLFDAPECRNLRDGLQLEATAIFIHGLAARAFRFSPAAQGLLSAGIEGPTTATSLAIERLAEAAEPVRETVLAAASADEALAGLERSEAGRAWLAELAAFLETYGHRAPKEFDLGAPRWCEAPAMIVDLVAAHLRCSGETVRARIEALRTKRRAVLAEAIGSRQPWRRPWLALLARLVELYMPLREAPKHYGMRVFQRMRMAALELGCRFVARGLIERTEDVFFMTWEEVAALTRGGTASDDLRVQVARRQAEYSDFLANPAPDFLRSDGVPVVESLEAAHEEGLLRGTPISVGRVVGRVRRLTEPDPRQVGPGDVIVVRFADPGWTPLFPRVAAVVMEVGGAMCHAAVVAREMGVPAVFGVREAMSLLADGTEVEVDGAEGTVRLHRSG